MRGGRATGSGQRRGGGGGRGGVETFAPCRWVHCWGRVCTPPSRGGLGALSVTRWVRGGVVWRVARVTENTKRAPKIEPCSRCSCLNTSLCLPYVQLCTRERRNQRGRSIKSYTAARTKQKDSLAPPPPFLLGYHSPTLPPPSPPPWRGSGAEGSRSQPTRCARAAFPISRETRDAPRW